MKKLMIILLLTTAHSYGMYRPLVTALARANCCNTVVKKVHTTKTILSSKEPKGSTSWATYAEYIKAQIAEEKTPHQEINTQVKELLRLQKAYYPKSKLNVAPIAPEVASLYTIADIKFDDHSIYLVLKPKDPHSQLPELCDKIPVYDFLANKHE